MGNPPSAFGGNSLHQKSHGLPGITPYNPALKKHIFLFKFISLKPIPRFTRQNDTISTGITIGVQEVDDKSLV